MTTIEYKKLIKNWTKERIKHGMLKGSEYANSTDQLDSFKRIGQNQGLLPAQVVMVFVAKHIDSLNYYVRHQGQYTPIESVESRIMDVQNYLDLLYGIITEERHVQTNRVSKRHTPRRPHH